MSAVGQWYYRVAATRAGHACARSALAALRALRLGREFCLPLDALALDHALVRELMTLWSRLHWAGTDGMMPPKELLALVQLAYACEAEGDTVELGSWVGLTTCYLAAACRARGRGEVVAVDTFEGTMEGGGAYPAAAKYGGSTLHAFERNACAAGMEDVVRPWVGLTTDVAKQRSDRPVRFLFIDADHSYEGAKADFECWSPMVVPGGLIVFHDYQMEGIARYVDAEIVGANTVDAVPGRVLPNLYAVTKKACSEAPVTPRFESLMPV